MKWNSFVMYIYTNDHKLFQLTMKTHFNITVTTVTGTYKVILHSRLREKWASNNNWLDGNIFSFSLDHLYLRLYSCQSWFSLLTTVSAPTIRYSLGDIMEREQLFLIIIIITNYVWSWIINLLNAIFIYSWRGWLFTYLPTLPSHTHAINIIALWHFVISCLSWQR